MAAACCGKSHTCWSFGGQPPGEGVWEAAGQEQHCQEECGAVSVNLPSRQPLLVQCELGVTAAV